MRTTMLVLAIYFLIMAIYIWFLPQTFYDNTPGLSAMGPFNLHFIRDVALVFLASGGAIVYGWRQRNQVALVCGAMWPFLHALFHVQIWGHRGFPFDYIWAVDLVGVVLPGVVAMFIAVRLKA